MLLILKVDLWVHFQVLKCKLLYQVFKNLDLGELKLSSTVTLKKRVVKYRSWFVFVQSLRFVFKILKWNSRFNIWVAQKNMHPEHIKGQKNDVFYLHLKAGDFARWV